MLIRLVYDSRYLFSNFLFDYGEIKTTFEMYGWNIILGEVIKCAEDNI